MPEHVKLSLITIVLVFSGCAGAFLLWMDTSPLPATLALFGAVAAEVAFWIRVGQRVS